MTKPTITDIKIDKKELKELKSMLNSGLIGAEAKQRRQRHLVGECLICGEIPTKKVTYDMDGVRLIEKYCKKHFRKIKWDNK